MNGKFPSYDQWCAMVDNHMSKPIPLGKEDLNRMWFYYRKYGIFYVGWASQQSAMSLLLAFEHGLLCGVEISDELKLDYSYGTAMEFLKLPGTAYKNDRSKHIFCFNGSLSPIEKRIFKNIKYLD